MKKKHKSKLHSVKVIHPLRSKIINVASGYQKIESNYLFKGFLFSWVSPNWFLNNKTKRYLDKQTDFLISLFIFFFIPHFAYIFPFFLRRQIMFKWCRYPFYFFWNLHYYSQHTAYPYTVFWLVKMRENSTFQMT